MDGMLGYGPFDYRYASGLEGDACKLSMASNASYIFAVLLRRRREGLRRRAVPRPASKASIGKACVRFKELADPDEKTLVALIKETARMGLAA